MFISCKKVIFGDKKAKCCKNFVNVNKEDAAAASESISLSFYFVLLYLGFLSDQSSLASSPG
jgi:hypothetical protein